MLEKFEEFNFEIISDDEIKVDKNLDDYLKKRLIEKRYKHSYSVAYLMYKIALANNLKNPLKYFFTGLIHDIGKYVDKKETLFIMNSFYKDFLSLPYYSYHSFVGVYLAINDLKVKDEEVLNAIKFHTTGKGNMDDLSLVLYASDKIEPLRGYDSSEMIKGMIKDYKTGFKKVVYECKIFLDNVNNEKNYLTDEMYDYYL